MEKMEAAVKEEEAEAFAKKLQRNKFDYNDFLQQSDMFGRLGAMNKVAKLIPGLNKVDDKSLNEVRNADVSLQSDSKIRATQCLSTIVPLLIYLAVGLFVLLSPPSLIFSSLQSQLFMHSLLIVHVLLVQRNGIRLSGTWSAAK